MDNPNETQADLDKISVAAESLHGVAAALWDLWKVQGDLFSLRCGAGHLFIGRRGAVTGIVFVKNDGTHHAISGAPLEAKVELLYRVEELFDAYGLRAKKLWRSIDEVLPSLAGIDDRAIDAARRVGPKR